MQIVSLGYLLESFLVNKAIRYDIKGKKYINTLSKYYFSDIGLRNAILNMRQQEESRTRSRVEHIFGFMENTMHRLYIRTVGLARATAVIGLINLTYNMSRYQQIVRLNLLKD